MLTDSFFAVMCGGMFALLFGLMLCLGGYRLFLVVLPIWSFFCALAWSRMTPELLSLTT